MFPSLAVRETYAADANFASETCVSQFSHPRNHVWKTTFLQQCLARYCARFVASLARDVRARAYVQGVIGFL